MLAEDRDRALATLPHELIHVLLAEHFPNAAPPRWAEEGLALLNDAPSKQKRHLNDLRYALDTNSTLPLDRLFATANYPTGWQRSIFYGQSMSIVAYLTQRDSPEQFMRFVALSMDSGHERALKTIYGIDGLDDLRRLWLAHATTSLPGSARKE